MKKVRKKWDFLGIRSVWNDIINYIDWIKTIKKEKNNTKSVFNKFQLDHDWFRNVFVIVTLPGEDANLPENIQRLRVIESLRSINQYFDVELCFSEYLIPDFNRIYMDDEPTLNFMIIYRFIFRKLTWWWLFSRFAILTTLVIGAFQIQWINLFEWISNLI